MSILGKVKKMVGAEDTAEEKKPTKAKKAVVAKTVAEPTEAHEHDHGDHAGHDHSEATTSSMRPASVSGAVGNGATKYIVRPLVSEKGTRTAEHNTHLFEVLLTANKRAIREAIEKIYDVKVTKVHTSRMDGKKVRSGKTKGQRSNFKKAYVTLAKGQTISLFKGV